MKQNANLFFEIEEKTTRHFSTCDNILWLQPYPQELAAAASSPGSILVELFDFG